jgi:hypothetical protein
MISRALIAFSQTHSKLEPQEPEKIVVERSEVYSTPLSEIRSSNYELKATVQSAKSRGVNAALFRIDP